mmetsp:Transcript_4841/g.18099  ORF Transcript_4841/g.18099 Transcript_4841/m.18099 type:complete len:513 (-) Transcript_4841:108-1646(-)|eukprot:CAMPEP_0117443204 /NCGR_PEP_ID=MMETSP0759-20121206/4570_1 /TAXON_ID=63605 /ORGANISM="Percolomonas cosmopolitus, Strain WS" /LENGTH=512 /DNA_ID=CAMNT_0005235163 /DNA_START=297 /DNA_END=1835 /DNA_ORIENTATION=+
MSDSFFSDSVFFGTFEGITSSDDQFSSLGDVGATRRSDASNIHSEFIKFGTSDVLAEPSAHLCLDGMEDAPSEILSMHDESSQGSLQHEAQLQDIEAIFDAVPHQVSSAHVSLPLQQPTQQAVPPSVAAQPNPTKRSITKRASPKKTRLATPPKKTLENSKKRKRATPSTGDSTSVSKRPKLSKSDIQDRERLSYLNSLSNLTEEQKAEKKKVYNRITARESRRRTKDLQKESEQRISELEQENMELKQKLAQMEKKLKAYVHSSSSPHSPLNSEGSNSDSEGEYPTSMSLAALTVLLIAVAVLLIASATAAGGNVSSKDVVQVAPKQTCGVPPVHSSYPLLPSIGSTEIAFGGTTDKKLLLSDASQQTVYIPNYGAGSNFDTPESLEKAYFYTTEDDEGKKTIYFYCPAIVPLLTDSSLGAEIAPDVAANNGGVAKDQRIVFVYPSEVYQSENEHDERIIKLGQMEVEKINNLKDEAYLILQNGVPSRGGVASVGSRGGVKIGASPRSIIM